MQPENLLKKMVRPLLRWYDTQARELPWRENAEPYRVWISEIMLQQTRVEAVRPYFTRFLAELPDVFHLAAASEERLLKLWEGLGYYNRAHNLQKAARILVERHGGVFPRTREELLSLPGIGDYTAGAIASICFHLPEPAVDGNVLRVIARLTGDRSDILSPARKRAVTAQLRAVYPKERSGDFTQSLMELGALVCIPNGAPHCERCPLAQLCTARNENTTAEIPVKSRGKARRSEERTVFLLRCGDRIALRKRPSAGLLAGLWELPNVDGALTIPNARQILRDWGLATARLKSAGKVRHIFSHIEWQMTVYRVECHIATAGFEWVTGQMLAHAYSLPAAFQTPLAAAMAL